jgi:ectoine hydroxylase
VNQFGLVSAKGSSGTVLFFHGNIFHASTGNLSPFDRNMFMVTYNSIENTLLNVEKPRPEFIANRNFTPIEPIADEYVFPHVKV